MSGTALGSALVPEVNITTATSSGSARVAAAPPRLKRGLAAAIDSRVERQGPHATAYTAVDGAPSASSASLCSRSNNASTLPAASHSHRAVAASPRPVTISSQPTPTRSCCSVSSGCLQLRLTTIPPSEVIARLSASESGHGWHRTASLLPRSAPCCCSSATADSTSSANDLNDTVDGAERDDQTSRKG